MTTMTRKTGTLTGALLLMGATLMGCVSSPTRDGTGEYVEDTSSRPRSRRRS
jgi:hypothetical protein